MFDNCIIHIGTEKTGTSSIQAMLFANAEHFAAHGFHIPSAFGRGNNRRFVHYAMDDEQIDDGKRAAGLVTAEALNGFRSEIEDRVKRMATKQSGKTLVISSEHCHSRLTSETSVRRLKNLLEPYCAGFQIVCYLRPQHEMAASLYSTALRVGHADFPKMPEPGTRPRYYDYDALLDRWASVFGESNVVPRIYEPSRSIEDFLAFCRLPDPAVSPPPENTRLDGRTQAFLRTMNGHLPREERGNLVGLIPSAPEIPPDAPSREQAEKFQASFDASNERVRARWFPDRDKLFSDASLLTYPEEERSYEMGLSEAFQMFAEIWKGRR